jgi:CarD family transcriptional regulator
VGLRRRLLPAGVAVKKVRKGAGLYRVGDKVVYPHHGAGTVVKKEKREVLGEKREYLTIKILHNDMTVNVPAENAEKVGLRKVIGEDMVKVVVKALTGGGTQMPKNWNRRFKHNRDKMKTGDILELAEVVRNLSLRDREKGLSTGEKQMFVKAKKILASELMYAKDMDEEQAAEWLDDVLAGAASTNGQATAPKKTSPKPPSRTASRAATASSGARAASRGATKTTTVKKAAAKPAAKTKPKAETKTQAKATASR